MREIAPLFPSCRGLQALELQCKHLNLSKEMILRCFILVADYFFRVHFLCKFFSALICSSSDNPIGVLGACALALVLPECVSLTRLDISCCSIEDKGANVIAGVLPSTPALEFLDISGAFFTLTKNYSCFLFLFFCNLFKSIQNENFHKFVPKPFASINRESIGHQDSTCVVSPPSAK
jgi:hypothetical protein